MNQINIYFLISKIIQKILKDSYPVTRLFQPNSPKLNIDWVRINIFKKFIVVIGWFFFRAINRIYVLLIDKNLFFFNNFHVFQSTYLKGQITNFSNHFELYMPELKYNLKLVTFAGLIVNSRGNILYTGSAAEDIKLERLLAFNFYYDMPSLNNVWYVGNKLPYNYAHFFHFFLFPFSLLEKVENVNIIFCFDLANFQKDFLDLLNISNFKQIVNPILNIDSFLIPPSYKYGMNNLYSKTEMRLNKAMIFNLRKLLLGKIGLENRKKIFIDRGPYLRNISNFKTVTNYLRKLGFQIIELSCLTVKEQLTLFRNAEIIIAPHGASLSNIIVCDTNCRIIEIRTNFVKNNSEFSSMAQILGLQFDTVFTDKEDAVNIEDLKLN